MRSVILLAAALLVVGLVPAGGAPRYLVEDAAGDANVVSAIGDGLATPAQYAPADLRGLRLVTRVDEEGEPQAVEVRLATSEPIASPGYELAWRMFLDIGECSSALDVITDGELSDARIVLVTYDEGCGEEPTADQAPFYFLTGVQKGLVTSERWTVAHDAEHGEAVVTLPLGDVPASPTDDLAAGTTIRVRHTIVRAVLADARPGGSLDEMWPAQAATWTVGDDPQQT